MNPPAWFAERLREGCDLRPAGEGIWSVMPADTPEQRYDGRAAAYDRVIGTAVYNRLFWGSSPQRYADFARQAIHSAEGTPLLDAGCGSLVFTANVYAATHRPIVLLDQFIGMLEAARARLRDVAGQVPDTVVFLQGDLLDLPFHPGSFATVLCMGMLHLFEDVGAVVAELGRIATLEGQLFLTSLVAEHAVGKRYLALLHRAGEVAKPRTMPQLLDELQGMGMTHLISTDREGSMAFLVTRAVAAVSTAA